MTTAKNGVLLPIISISCPIVGLVLGFFKGVHEGGYMAPIREAILLGILGSFVGVIIALSLVSRKNASRGLAIFALVFTLVPLVLLLGLVLATL